MEEMKLHAMHAGVRMLAASGTGDVSIDFCTNNQNALGALAGGPTVGREYQIECLKDVKILKQVDCEVKGKWTPSNDGINGNKHGDTLAKSGTNQTTPGQWTRKPMS